MRIDVGMIVGFPNITMPPFTIANNKKEAKRAVVVRIDSANPENLMIPW
jgi:hypothetical protein